MAIPAPRPLGALRECVDVCAGSGRASASSHEGAAFSLREIALEYKPAQAELPIVLGVKGPRALALAGAVADGVLCSVMSSPGHVRRVREATAAARREAGPPTRFPMLAYVPVAIGRDAAAARHAVRPLLARYLAHLHGQGILAGRGRVGGGHPGDPHRARGGRVGGEPRDRRARRRLRAGRHARTRRARGSRDWRDAGLDTPIALPAGEADPVEQLGVIGAELGPWWRSRT